MTTISYSKKLTMGIRHLKDKPCNVITMLSVAVFLELWISHMISSHDLRTA